MSERSQCVELYDQYLMTTSFKLPKLSDSQLYRLAGNAVSVPVVSLIAERIFEHSTARNVQSRYPQR